MRYSIIKSPIIDKYYIWDKEEKKISSEKGFDIILEIVQDKIAIVGRETSYRSGYYYYLKYVYSLVDVTGRPISEKTFDFVYPNDYFIFCKKGKLPINKLSYLDKYIWENESGHYLSEYPFYSCGQKNAIIEVGPSKELWRNTRWYKYIGTGGEVQKEAEVATYNSVELALFGFPKHEVSNRVYIDVFGCCEDKKWERVNELIQRTDFDCCVYDFNLSEKYNFHNVRLQLAWDEFLLLIKMEKNQSYTGYCREPKYKESKCLAVLNDSFEVIFCSKDGFDINPDIFQNRIIINCEYILRSDGRLFSLPDNIKFDELKSDNCGFARIEKDDKIGFINNEGQFVIPPIFPKDRENGINEYLAEEEMREYQREIAGWTEDAFDGEPDAAWNID